MSRASTTPVAKVPSSSTDLGDTAVLELTGSSLSSKACGERLSDSSGFADFPLENFASRRAASHTSVMVDLVFSPFSDFEELLELEVLLIALLGDFDELLQGEDLSVFSESLALCGEISKLFGDNSANFGEN